MSHQFTPEERAKSVAARIAAGKERIRKSLEQTAAEEARQLRGDAEMTLLDRLYAEMAMPEMYPRQ